MTINIPKKISPLKLKIILQLHQKWLHYHPGGEKADLSNTDLSDSKSLSKKRLVHATLAGASLRYAKIIGTDLAHADLSYADLTGANLSATSLVNANLAHDTLQKTSLYNTNLKYANLKHTDLRYTNLKKTSLFHLHIQNTRFDPCYHNIPVTLQEVKNAILKQPQKLDMDVWHGDSKWKNKKAIPLEKCLTTHCIAGFAHHIAALRNPDLLKPKINIYLLARLARGEDAANRFFDTNQEILNWLKYIKD